MVPQSTMEAVLGARLEALGGVIHRGVTAIDLKKTSEGATVAVKSRAGEQLISARFVVGADGLRSTVRKAASIPFEGTSNATSFILADVRMEWPLGATEVSMFFSPSGLVVVAPLPCGRYRIVATLEEAPEQPSLADVQRLLDDRGPQARRARVEEVVWASRFRVQHRLAKAYRSGPYVLMGDAAHVHSPAGGQGMNTGLVDAIVLAEAFKRVVLEQAPEAVLDDYARTRRPAAHKVLALASRLTRMATLRSVPLRWIRNQILQLLDRSSGFKRALAMDLSGISRRSLSVLPSRGIVKAQQPWWPEPRALAPANPIP
jgi:2-polyprenyl-6-methoxyphenol hydroxylase-like FAD-dependent oxidoreductase